MDSKNNLCHTKVKAMVPARGKQQLFGQRTREVLAMAEVSSKRYYLHTVIGLVLMFGIGFLPPVGPLTPVGMQVGGILLGLL